jgi:two-component system, NarL family, sensor histidine kinase BarA
MTSRASSPPPPGASPPVPAAAASGPLFAADDTAFDGKLRLDDLVKREALTELCTSFYALFGIPVRIYSAEGALLSDVYVEQEACAYINTLGKGRSACASTVSAVKAMDPGAAGDTSHPCFSGAAYRIIAIEYEGRRIGRLVVGPFLPAGVLEPPESLLKVDPGMDAGKVRPLLLKMPRAKPETITRIATHLKAALDLILFSGHRALLTSHMHLASVKESYRELEEKTRKLQEAYDRLKELDRLKSNFLATVSHELRTPLTSIIGYSEMLVEGIAGTLAGEQKEFVQTIHEKGEQLLSLIMSLLDLSKLESGTMNVRARPTDLKKVLEIVQKTLAPAAQKKAVNLKIEVASDVPEMRADSERLRQVFLNLGENAVKFTPKGGTVTFRARMTTDSDEEERGPGSSTGFALLAPARARIEVRVIDTGIGIPLRERGRVFDPFYQVDSSSTREYGGTGLGLSIVKRLVDAHGGKIAIEDNEPKGTVFIVVLPIGSAANTAVEPRSVPPPTPVG